MKTPPAQELLRGRQRNRLWKGRRPRVGKEANGTPAHSVPDSQNVTGIFSRKSNALSCEAVKYQDAKGEWQSGNVAMA
jgi:hypothetical protein